MQRSTSKEDKVSIKTIRGLNERRRGYHYEYDTRQTPLGEGGTGTVYLGRIVDDYSGQCRDVAIKELRPGLPSHVIERSRRESSFQLKNDNLIEMMGFVEVPCKDESGASSIRYYVISEYLKGVSLDDFIDGNLSDNQGNVIPFAQEMYSLYLNDRCRFALTVAKNLLSGLSALHDAGYIHRDIDPSNIMITADGHFKLIDFGIAKKVNGSKTDESAYTQVGQFIGKPKYAAPELALGLSDSLSYPTDLYAVGIIMYQLVAGHVPYDGDMANVLDKQINAKLPLKDIPNASLRRIIAKATRKKIRDRYRSAAEFRVALDRIDLASNPIMDLLAGQWKMAVGLTSAVIIAILTTVLVKKNDIGSPILDQSDLVEADSAKPSATLSRQDSLRILSVQENREYISLLSKLENPDEAVSAFEDLKNLSKHASNNKVRHDATFLLSRIYFTYKNDAKPDSIKRYQVLLEKELPDDSERDILSHELLLSAVKNYNLDYQSLYELGCDYQSNGNRGASRDLDKSLDYFKQAKKIAELHGDEDYQKKINDRINVVERLIGQNSENK